MKTRTIFQMMLIALLALPAPCIAPVVFITSTSGNWFAATGY